MKTLRDVFVETLRERGVESLGTLSKRFRKSKDRIRDMALAVFYDLGAIAELPEPTNVAWDLGGRVTEGSKYAYVPSCMVPRFRIILDSDGLRARLPKWPYFIVDLMHWDKHTQTEKGKLCLQIVQAYSLVKSRFTGKELAVTWANAEFRDMIYMPLDRITAYPGPTSEFLREKGIDEVVLLDPWAEETLSESDLNLGAFIIGGIVDTSGSKRKTTPRIGEVLEEAGITVRRRKITLRGDVMGVPDRINRIIGILLRMMEGVPMDEAVYEFQEPRHAKWRLRRELPKRAFYVNVNGERRKAVSLSLLKEYEGWLKIRKKDFLKVAREMGLVVIDPEGDTGNILK
ncbi:MAG: tRNA (guanine-N2)-dimethyltransferase [Thermococci archaeon]|nr:tRNA (guanine-N2)-dimethyltransferase [Thermococci archaeon]